MECHKVHCQVNDVLMCHFKLHSLSWDVNDIYLIINGSVTNFSWTFPKQKCDEVGYYYEQFIGVIVISQGPFLFLILMVKNLCITKHPQKICDPHYIG